MLFDLKSLPRGRSVVTQEVALTEEQATQAGTEGAVSCTAKVDALQFQIHASVSFSCRVRIECSRCSRVFSLPLQGKYRLVLQNRHAPRGEAADEGSVDFFFSDEDSEVDTGPALYDEIMIAIPMMPLCSPDCEGTAYGTGRTAGASAGPASGETDPRWDALKKLKEKNKKSY
jgi:uncharacterized protein